MVVEYYELLKQGWNISEITRQRLMFIVEVKKDKLEKHIPQLIGEANILVHWVHYPLSSS